MLRELLLLLLLSQLVETPMPVSLTAPDSWATCHLPPTDYHLPTANCHLPTNTCQLPHANCHLQTATCKLPTNFFTNKNLARIFFTPKIFPQKKIFSPDKHRTGPKGLHSAAKGCSPPQELEKAFRAANFLVKLKK